MFLGHFGVLSLEVVDLKMAYNWHYMFDEAFSVEFDMPPTIRNFPRQASKNPVLPENSSVNFLPFGGFFLDLLRFNSENQIIKFLEKTRLDFKGISPTIQTREKARKFLKKVADRINETFPGSLLAPMIFIECTRAVHESLPKLFRVDITWKNEFPVEEIKLRPTYDVDKYESCWESVMDDFKKMTTLVMQFEKSHTDVGLLKQIFNSDFNNGSNTGRSGEYVICWSDGEKDFWAPYLFDNINDLIAFDVFNYHTKRHEIKKECPNCGHSFISKNPAMKCCTYPSLEDDKKRPCRIVWKSKRKTEDNPYILKIKKMYQKRIASAKKQGAKDGEELVKSRDELLALVSSGIPEEQIIEAITRDKKLYRDR